jgi:hypothetical protein
MIYSWAKKNYKQFLRKQECLRIKKLFKGKNKILYIIQILLTK